ncbi:MBL fold metallo-hydrolase [Engelhardtia mirabilis]|uniref:Beta-lactamase superfamily domain protein n=1 Tax=Engelhardtia mirabilis TaxID=2528011 RepID=A0A518BHB7_9BACT|nr:hypothetical protein Pla133_14480 [Planctomycetes bacterium Pla133]QDV00704.1 hypothetical protein Pla86_14470 [Planctomycetes bacterium Pla86]
MDLGFETIGNATVIAYDGGPVLATDPWLDGPAYFGSWTLSHEIPEAQRAAIDQCRYLWISHGHPDHLCHATLARMKGKQVLLADHVGGRIARELAAEGFDVRVLPDGEWTELSPRLRVLAMADYYQDASLLMDLGGRLVADTNDAGDRGGGDLLRRAARSFDRSYLLALTGHGDADLINFFDEHGARVVPPAASKEPLGPGINGLLDHFGLKSFVPFSSMHRYQRTDSAWANEYLTGLDEHARGFDATRGELLPPFAHVDFTRDEVYGLDPRPASEDLFPPEDFGDDWSEPLEAADVERLRAYLGRVEHWRGFLGWIDFKVGGRVHRVEISPDHAERGLTLEVPRHSLMTAVEWRIFDDVLISNFARCTLHGAWHGRGTGAMYPDFNPFLTKFGDNGGAWSAAELRRYFRTYLDRGFTRLEGDAAAQRYV